MAPSKLIVLLLASALAAGCISESTAPDEGTAPDDARPPTGDKAGTATSHASPTRTEGDVVVRQEGSQYVAMKTITVDNDFGGAARSHAILSTFNGAVALQPSQDGGYHLTANLHGRGATEQEAREALDLLELQNTDELRDGLLEVSFALTANTPGMLPLPVVLATGVNNGAAYLLQLPPEPAHDVEAGTTNGAIALTGLHGPHLKAGTSNGAIAVALEPTRTAAVRLATSNGAVAVALTRDDAVAYDITADTTNGRVIIDVEGHESVDDDHGDYRSPDWSSAAIQLTLDLDTTNGSIVVED